MWGRSNNTPPPPPSGAYNRVPGGDQYSSLPSRSQLRPNGPPGQYQGYNDPPNAPFEKRGEYGNRRSPAPPGYHQQRQSVGQTQFGVVGSPSEALALTNCLICNPSDFSHGQHVLVNGSFSATVKHDDTGKVQPGQIAASALYRQWIGLSITGDVVTIDPLPTPPHPAAPLYLQSIDIEVGFFRPNQQGTDQLSVDDMIKILLKAFSGIIMGVDECIAFEFRGIPLKGRIKGLSVLELADEQRRGMQGGAGRRDSGILMEKTDVNVMKDPTSPIKLKSSAKKAPPNAILAPNFKFEDMGIGGLDTEFSEIFRRAFASRVFPPGLVDKLGIQHVKGIILHGPPGTGKTLIARQIGKMLNAREPKIVNGPEILNKYVGASEENIRKLFADAEKEYKEKGDESGLHIIIFDELDAIFKQRGSTNSGTGVGDTVVNQLLSKMDGVDQLNNILIIGMTNRLDMIDEALLRPGRLEVHMEISLPDEKGRLQILSIHTSKMRVNKVMDDDVDLYKLATLTKNFSGAEITGLVKSATSFAFNRHVKVGTMAGISDDVENLKVNMNDFVNALDEVHPAFGVSEEELERVVQNGIIHYDSSVDVSAFPTIFFGTILTVGIGNAAFREAARGTRKTALAASIAQASEFPFIKLISPDNMVGFSEPQKVQAITKVFSDSYKSPLSVVVVDNIERLIDWTPMGARFSNSVLQTLLVLIARRPPKGRRLLIIATSSLRPILTDLGLSETFDSEQRVPPITTIQSLDRVLREVELFPNDSQHQDAIRMLTEAGFGSQREGNMNSRMQIGIKRLLSIVEMARQEPDNVAERLLNALIGLGM
ncbi:hypothetical protein NP233_g3205 [Leucocoprinus birnbaumii]|uniref:Vesicular-fusion protein SEC18 n=1 Tax=Leucocoprinus birnbaumii TaxID=56174 RepID=A0AAD5YWM5_9AGAR|nr:hypothetical protein NP233_g3205 [Leucocoprinus birnbaumii]